MTTMTNITVPMPMLIGMTRRTSGTQMVIGVTRPREQEVLVSCDDFALVAMHDRRGRHGAGAAAQDACGAAPRDGGAAAAAPGRRFDANGAEPRERFAQRAVALGDQKRQTEDTAPR